jgi:hypothetical protein
MSWWTRYKRWLHVVETGGGWLVERDGRTVALLTEPRLVEMFWLAWRIEPLADDAAERAALFSPGYWDVSLLLRTAFRSREFNVVSDTGFWAGAEPLRDGRLVMRGLYQPIREPWIIDELVLWIRRFGARG